ncbi:hypothetical protein OAN307_c01990 [Octadecabacter antarcticus 307]|uniref:PH domain-containing protein n=1 Tax=Octadecabacter antarcticus 307 TaxID=391626 RepID=M9R6P0_9RHOB|nr:hypothetical protein [Octadecabacter antarcticus]AGI65966.1 hypothetical protein OAN307_c01990 [Octadecabacter antarcticus 307]
MTDAPPLNDDEVILLDHVPSLRAFRRVALLLIAVTLLPTIAFAVVFPDTYWPIAPLFVTCFLLFQERFTLGRHRAWVTNQRVLVQGGESAAWDTVSEATMTLGFVKLRRKGAGRTLTLSYAADATALINAINSARGTT